MTDSDSSLKKDEALRQRVLDTIEHYGSDILASEVMQGQKKFLQHGEVNLFLHCLHVTYQSLLIAYKLGISVNEEAVVRGGLLHDYYHYDWHDPDSHKRGHAFRHPYIACENAENDYSLTDLEKEIILRHMFPVTPLPPVHKEALLISIADKICAVIEMLPAFESRKIYLERY